MKRALQKIDVLIVGYGPVGATAANFLGQAGLDVVVVERDPTPYSRARAISTDEEVLRCWQHAGLAEELKRDMLGDRPIDFVDDRGRSFMSFEITPKGNGHPPQMFIYQPVLEDTLRRGVDRFPNVEVLLEREAGRVRQGSDGVSLEITDLRTNERSELRATYLLACDGGASPVRTQLGIGFDGRTYEDPWVVIDTKVIEPWPEVDRLRFHCDPKRPAVDCPTPLGHHRWEFPILPGEDRDHVSSEAEVWRMLSRYGITERNVELLRRAVYVHHVRFAERWREGDVFLLGDAAHCMPPWIGQGMASGVRDAENLCWKLDSVLAGRAAPELLDSYEPERQPHVRRTTDAAVFFGRVITERNGILAEARNHLFRGLMRTPFVGSFLREGDWMTIADYSKVGFVDRAAEDDLVGKRLTPQVAVSDATGHEALIDDFVSGGWSVLMLPGAHGRTAAARRAWEAVGARTFQLVDGAPGSTGELRDAGGELIAALRERGVDAMVLRPDAFVYTAARAGESLAGPPISLARPRVAPLPAPPASGERALAALASRLDDSRLELLLGNPLALRAIFGEMAGSFVPRVANGFEGEIEYELSRRVGPASRFTIAVEGGSARARAGGAADPALRVRLGVADFLRMAAGELDQTELLKSRRVALEGDGLLGARMGALFGRPAAVDIYVAPKSVDEPELAATPSEV